VFPQLFYGVKGIVAKIAFGLVFVDNWKHHESVCLQTYLILHVRSGRNGYFPTKSKAGKPKPFGGWECQITIFHNVKYRPKSHSCMQKLGFLMSLLLLAAVMVGPIGFSFAEMSASSNATSTDTAKTGQMTQKMEAMKKQTPSRVDEKVTQLKEKALKKPQLTLDDLVAMRSQKVQETKSAPDSKMVEKRKMAEQDTAAKKAAFDEKMAQKRTQTEDKMAKKTEMIDKKMAEKRASMMNEKKSEMKSKTETKVPSISTNSTKSATSNSTKNP